MLQSFIFDIIPLNLKRFELSPLSSRKHSTTIISNSIISQDKMLKLRNPHPDQAKKSPVSNPNVPKMQLFDLLPTML